MKLLILLLLTSCASKFSSLDCIARSERLGVEYSKARIACELDRDSYEKHLTN